MKVELAAQPDTGLHKASVVPKQGHGISFPQATKQSSFDGQVLENSSMSLMDVSIYGVPNKPSALEPGHPYRHAAPMKFHVFPTKLRSHVDGIVGRTEMAWECSTILAAGRQSKFAQDPQLTGLASENLMQCNPLLWGIRGPCSTSKILHGEKALNDRSGGDGRSWRGGECHGNASGRIAALRPAKNHEKRAFFGSFRCEAW